MASVIGMNARIARATERTNDALPRVVQALGLDIEPIPQHRDNVYLGALRAEWLADTLEAITEAAEARPTPMRKQRSPKSAA